MAKRQLRGRLSSIDKLPKEADEIVLWAHGELSERARSQKDILTEFNEKLAEIDLEPISKSAFNRHSISMTTATRRIEDAREITKVLTEKLEVGAEDDLTIMISELIKTLVFELVNSKGLAGFTPKQAMEMASAIKAASSAQHISSDRRAKLESKLANKVDDAIDKVVEATKGEAGLDNETIKQIRENVLGIKAKPKDGK